MTEELIMEIQKRIDDICAQKPPMNSVMGGVIIGLQEAQEIVEQWKEDRCQHVLDQSKVFTSMPPKMQCTKCREYITI